MNTHSQKYILDLFMVINEQNSFMEQISAYDPNDFWHKTNIYHFGTGFGLEGHIGVLHCKQL